MRHSIAVFLTQQEPGRLIRARQQPGYITTNATGYFSSELLSREIEGIQPLHLKSLCRPMCLKPTTASRFSTALSLPNLVLN